ncbi:hypothetical protein [Streptomyces yaizuensis]|uniref:Uncharacterized protein n=1 Tax=Streptomyces yaizuensis TaxID=2989713 RepID=A0ABQ5NZK2_9ACTN|nr:hypothetical protein [Streptomyces sp. YSPA8]GLF95789.1 hypothetical protein SYYSPA8_15850 [Streptomyces sp. YSPA8]
MPYQEDLGAAFAELRRQVFEAREYYWWSGKRGRPWPRTEAELWDDEVVQDSGTHSVLDLHRIIGPDEEPDYHTLKQVTEDEALRVLGARKLTRAHVPQFDSFEHWRWYGRCAVLHDERGEPQEIYFWGYSGD